MSDINDRQKIYEDEFQFDRESEQVTCICGNKTFTLRYGDCEIFAKCSNPLCKREESVYSG